VWAGGRTLSLDSRASRRFLVRAEARLSEPRSEPASFQRVRDRAAAAGSGGGRPPCLTSRSGGGAEPAGLRPPQDLRRFAGDRSRHVNTSPDTSGQPHEARSDQSFDGGENLLTY
jgi:hypothetical protein